MRKPPHRPSRLPVRCNDSRGLWRSIPSSAQDLRLNQMITIPTGVVHQPPRGWCWTANEPEYIRLLNDKLSRTQMLDKVGGTQ